MSTKATGNKNTLPSLIVLPLNMVSAVGKISRRLPAESTRILLPFPRRFGVTFSGFLIFKTKTQRKRSECEHFQNCVKQHICGNQTCNSLCWKCRPKRCSMYCPDFTPRLCDRLKKPPYVCNDCPQIRSCSHDFYFYRANYANDIYSETKSSSRIWD